MFILARPNLNASKTDFNPTDQVIDLSYCRAGSGIRLANYSIEVVVFTLFFLAFTFVSGF